jgi:hypothetical protein
MKFQLFSDIHTELTKYYPRIVPKADYLILAGDIGKVTLPNFQSFMAYCSENWKIVIYIFVLRRCASKRQVTMNFTVSIL